MAKLNRAIWCVTVFTDKVDPRCDRFGKTIAYVKVFVLWQHGGLQQQWIVCDVYVRERANVLCMLIANKGGMLFSGYVRTAERNH